MTGEELLGKGLSVQAFLIGLLVIFTGCLAQPEISNVQKLHEKLFKNYNNTTRPVQHHTNETVVEIGIAPLYLVDLDEEKSLFSLDSWLVLAWYDYRLAWNASDYEGLTDISVPDEWIWQPDISVYNGHSGNIDPKKNTHLFINSGGDVFFDPPAQVTTYCSTALDQGYPRDEVLCNITFGSWAHNGWQINLILMNDDVYMHQLRNTNPKWEILTEKVKLIREVNHYNDHEEPYISVVAQFPLKRRPPQELQVIWSPCVLVMMLTLAMFWMPPDSGKKLVLGSVLFMVLTMLTVYVAAVTKSPIAPKAAVSFIASTMYAVAVAIVLEIIVINLSSIVGPCRPPEVLVRVLSGNAGKFIGVWPRWLEHVPGDKIQLKEDSDQQVTSQPTPKDEWILVAASVDRFLFVLYIIILAAIHQA